MVNRNVKVVCIFMFVRQTFSSLFSQTPLSYYVFILTGSNTKVGIIQGIQGILNLSLALPFAMLGDSWSRQKVLRLAAAIGLLAAMVTSATLYVVLRDQTRFLALCACTGLWGMYMGAHSATLEAVFGDSVESGKRSQLYSYKAATRTAGSSVGPCLSMIIFSSLTDQWTLENLTIIMSVGMAVALVACGLLFLVRDDATLGPLSESLLLQEAPAPQPPSGPGVEGGPYSAVSGDVEAVDGEDDGGGEGDNGNTESAAVSEAVLTHASALPSETASSLSPPSSSSRHNAAGSLARAFRSLGGLIPRLVCGRAGREDIAGVVACTDFVSTLGSGMTVNFFPLWFGEVLGVTPIGVMAIRAAGPLGITVATLTAAPLARALGRVQVTVACKASGVALLVLLAMLPPDQVPTGWIVAVFLLRTWLMNCTAGLTKSVLNDFVSIRNRAKWNTLESVNTFSWSGSAALGGYLIDAYGYRATFLTTASLQAVSFLLLSTLVRLVPVEDFTSKKKCPIVPRTPSCGSSESPIVAVAP